MKISNSVCCLCVFAGGASYLCTSQSSSSVASSAALSMSTRSYFTSSNHHRQLDSEQLGVSLQVIDNESPIAQRALRETHAYSESQKIGSGLTYHKFSRLGNPTYALGDYEGFKKLFDQLKPMHGSGEKVSSPYFWTSQDSLQEDALALFCLYGNAAGLWRSDPGVASLQSFKQAIEQFSKQINRDMRATDLRQYILFIFWINDGEKIGSVLQQFREAVLSDLTHSWIEKVVTIIKDQSARKSSQNAKENEKVEGVVDPVEWVGSLGREIGVAVALYGKDVDMSKLPQKGITKQSFSSYLLLAFASELQKCSSTYTDTEISQWLEILPAAIKRCEAFSSFGSRGGSAENSLRSGGESPRSLPSIQVNDMPVVSPQGGSLKSGGSLDDGSPRSPQRFLAISPRKIGESPRDRVIDDSADLHIGLTRPDAATPRSSRSNKMFHYRRSSGIVDFAEDPKNVDSLFDTSVQYETIGEEDLNRSCWLKRFFARHRKTAVVLTLVVLAGIGYGAYRLYPVLVKNRLLSPVLA